MKCWLGQSYIDYARDKVTTLDCWSRATGVHSLEDLTLLILLEDFHANLPRELQKHLICHPKSSLEETTALADNFEVSQRLVSRGHDLENVKSILF